MKKRYPDWCAFFFNQNTLIFIQQVQVSELQEQVDRLTASEAVKELKIVELQREVESYQLQVANLEGTSFSSRSR